MNKVKLLKLLLSLKKTANQGLSLAELLVALIIGAIVLTAGTSGFVNLLNADRETDSKSTRLATLNRALGYVQNDIKGAVSVTAVSGGDCSGVTSSDCMVLTYSDTNSSNGSGGTIASCVGPDQLVYYGYEDISSGTHSWLKPGVLKRKVVDEQTRDDNSTPSDLSDDSCSVSTGNWQVVADGLISVNESNPNPSCNQDLSQWSGTNTTIYGDNGSGKGGFRFCLGDTTADNRLVRVFLYGHIIGGNDNNVIEANTVGFGRADN